MNFKSGRKARGLSNYNIILCLRSFLACFAYWCSKVNRSHNPALFYNSRRIYNCTEKIKYAILSD